MFQLNHQKYILLLSTMLLLNNCQSSSSNKDDNTTRSSNPIVTNNINNKVDIFMNGIINKKRVPGAVFAVAKENKVLYTKAFGVRNMDTQKKVNKDTLFHIGSTHKAITSLLIAILVDEGVLTWDTKAQDIYEDFTLSDETYASQITIRQLLDMSAGFPEEYDNPPSEARGLLEELTDISLNPPKSEYAYSNVSVSIAGYLAVLAHAKFKKGSISTEDLDKLHAGYEKLLREKVLVPIGMKSSYLYIDEAKATNRMSSSHYLKNGTFRVAESEDAQVDIFAPSGGLKSTVTDMIKYIMVEAQQGVTAEGKRIVSKKNMLVRQTLSKGVSTEEKYGLCLEIKTLDNGMPYIGIIGSFDNFNSTIGFFPNQKVSFVLLTNAQSKDIENLTGDEIEGQMAQWVNQF